jgi:hypothetical protein
MTRSTLTILAALILGVGALKANSESIWGDAPFASSPTVPVDVVEGARPYGE